MIKRVSALLGSAVVLVATAAALSAVASPAAAAPGAGSPAAQRPVSAGFLAKGKGRTDITVDAGAAAALSSLGVSVTPVRAGARTANGLPVFSFKIVGNPADGTIEHIGGLLLRSGGAHVLLTRFTIDVDRGVVSGVVNLGARVDLFTLGAATPAGLTLALTPGAAAALNATFGVSAFTAGLVFGYGNPVVRA